MNQIIGLDIDFDEYAEYIKILGSLSRLFSTNNIPFIHYRTVEILYARLDGGSNIAGEDSSFDLISKLNKPIGIKTFGVPSLNTKSKKEKVAEFNSEDKNRIKDLDYYKAVIEISHLRNSRIKSDLIQKNVTINDAFYHCLIRQSGGVYIHQEPYELIDVAKIKPISNNGKEIEEFTGYHFTDGINNYTFSNSKSTLFKSFQLSRGYNSNVIDIDILDDPLLLLKKLSRNKNQNDFVNTTVSSATGYLDDDLIAGIDFVILPLYSTRDSRNKLKSVPERSGINQWVAQGRKRDEMELYIPIPAQVKRLCPNFFPPRMQNFKLTLPNKQVIDVSVCQDGGKALMSNPNSVLGKYIFSVIDVNNVHATTRKPITYEDLSLINKDSIKIVKINGEYHLRNFCIVDSYEEFILSIEN